MPTEVRIVQARVEPMGHGFRRIADPRDDAVDPVIEFDDVSMLTPATLPPRIWESVCGTKTRSNASAYSFRARLLSGNPRCKPSRARTSSRRVSNLDRTKTG